MWTTLKEMFSNHILAWEYWGSHIALVITYTWKLILCTFMHINVHTSTETKVNTPMLSKNLLSPSLPSSLPPNPSLHILSSVWQREEDRQRKRKEKRERETQRNSWLACRQFGLIQEDVERPLISNLSPLSLACLHSLLSISRPVYRSVHLTQPLLFFVLIHYVFHAYCATAQYTMHIYIQLYNICTHVGDTSL